MSRVSYFQRFSQRENHATNNTLLILRTFYEASPFKVQAVLNDLTEEQYAIGLQFGQQVKLGESIPDALISQTPLKIYIETKRGDALYDDQIRRHIDGAAADSMGDGTTVVLGLTKEPISQSEQEAFKAYARERGIMFSSTTFSALTTSLAAQCQPSERDLEAMVEDFRSYLSDEGLLEERNQLMPIFPCGASFPENERFHLYYEPPSRPCKRNYRFIGIYKDKAVRLIGEVTAIGVFDPTGPSWEQELGTVSAEMTERVRELLSASNVHDRAKEPKRFYFVNAFVPTEIRKSTTGGIMGMRYLNLTELQGPEVSDYTVEELSSALSGRTFD